MKNLNEMKLIMENWRKLVIKEDAQAQLQKLGDWGEETLNDMAKAFREANPGVSTAVGGEYTQSGEDVDYPTKHSPFDAVKLMPVERIASSIRVLQKQCSGGKGKAVEALNMKFSCDTCFGSQEYSAEKMEKWLMNAYGKGAHPVGTRPIEPEDVKKVLGAYLICLKIVVHGPESVFGVGFDEDPWKPIDVTPPPLHDF